MKNLFFTIALLLGSSAWADLNFNGGAIRARTTWKQGPVVTGESILEIQWKTGADNRPLDPGAFSVAIEMPDMPEMQNPPTEITANLDNGGKPILGSYLIKSVYFTMGGAWNVDVTFTYPDGIQETQFLSLQIPE